MKIHCSLDINMKSITKDFMKHGIVLVDDLGTQTLEQFEDIEYALLNEIGPAADSIPTETEEYKTSIGTVFAIRNPKKMDDLEASLFVAKAF